MPRMTDTQCKEPEFLRRQVPKDAAITAIHKNLAYSAHMKAERAAEVAFYMEQQDVAYKVARMVKLNQQIAKLKEAVIQTEADFASFTGDKLTSLEMLGYSLEIYLEETKAMLRNSERELSQLLGNPPSAEELEEQALKHTFMRLSFKAGMFAYVREDILESAPYHLDLKDYWSRHIEECQEAIQE